MTGERRLLRLGEYLVGRACQRLPADVRAERCREWVAELPVILHDPQVRFAPWRAARMLGYAADTLRGTAMMPGRTPGGITRSRPALLFLVTFLAGFVAVNIWLIVLAPGDGRHYLDLVSGLLFAALCIGLLAHASGRMTTRLAFSTGLAFEVGSVWQVVHAPGNWVNYFWAAVLGFTLLAALRVRWFRRLLGPARRA
jgi:hypothetical protein